MEKIHLENKLFQISYPESLAALKSLNWRHSISGLSKKVRADDVIIFNQFNFFVISDFTFGHTIHRYTPHSRDFYSWPHQWNCILWYFDDIPIVIGSVKLWKGVRSSKYPDDESKRNLESKHEPSTILSQSIFDLLK